MESSVMVTKEIMGKLEELFQAIAGIAQQGGQHFWPILIRQEMIKGIGALIIAFILNIFWAVFFLKGRKYGNMQGYSDESIAFYIISSTIMVLGLLLYFLGSAHLLNPEYYALRNLIEAVSKGE